MFENIEAQNPNFCIGPQSGTFCTVDSDVSPVVMHVKNDIGSLIRTYTFYPQDILYTGSTESYPFYKFITLQYVGHYEQPSYYDGAIFYTLEKKAICNREYYTYDDDEDPDKTENRVEYSGNIIRKWKLDNTGFRLVLDQTFIKESDDDNWFDANAFAIKHTLTTFDDHTSAGTGEIEITTTSGLNKYDILFLGPSTDTSNYGEVEEVYVHSINGTTVEIKTYGGGTPTEWEYVSGDPILFLQDLFLFSNPRPLINEQEIAYGYETVSGTLYKLDQINYGIVTEIRHSGIYDSIYVSTWNNSYGTLSFVKGTNLLHLDINDYDIIKSQNIHLEDPNGQSVIQIYDIDIKDNTIYKLQKKILQWDDDGIYFIISWGTYNYHEDTLIPYLNSTSLSVTEKIITRNEHVFITVVAVDQYNVSLFGKDVWFTAEGDIGGSLDPVGGYMSTDIDGKATIKYTAGGGYQGQEVISVKINGGNSANGSVYVLSEIYIYQHYDINESCIIYNTPITHSTSTNVTLLDDFDTKVMLKGRVAFVAPGDNLINNSMEGWTACSNPVPLITTLKKPLISINYGNAFITTNNLFLYRAYKEETYSVRIYNKETIQNEHQISSNYISRHLLLGNIDFVSLNQYIFVQRAIPAMWSEKNNIDTNYEIQLLPFGYSLNQATLSVKLKEISYVGDTGWYDVTHLGTMESLTAGIDLFGIVFYYNPTISFHHNSTIYVHIEVYDFAIIPNLIILDYWFKIIQDYKAPYILNNNPGREEYNVSLDTEITFDIVDEGEGVNINTLEVFINQRVIEFIYEEYESGNYHITCILPFNFHFGQTVSVNVQVLDRSDNLNRLRDGWCFYCVGSDGPWFNMDNIVPKLCTEGTCLTQGVSAQVYGINDTGIDYNSIKMDIAGRNRNINITPIIYRLG